MRSRGPALAAVPWLTLLGSAALAVALLAGLGRDPGRLLEAARWAAVAMALGLAGVFDDPSAELHASLPVPDRRVRLGALVVAVPVLGLAWSALAWLGDQPVVTGDGVAAAFDACLSLARAGLGSEAAGVLAVTLAAAALAARWSGGIGSGVAGAAAVVLLYAGRPLLPDRLTLAAGPLDVAWRATQWRWAIVVAIGAVGVFVLTADRWRRPRRLRRIVAGVVGLAVAAVAFATTTSSRSVEDHLGDLVAVQGLAAVEISARGPVDLEAAADASPGTVTTLTVTVVLDGVTARTSFPVTGSVTARELRRWSATVPAVGDGELLTHAVVAAPPSGLEPVDPEAPPVRGSVAEVVVDHRTDQVLASVAAPGERSCGVSVAGVLHGAASA